MVRKFEIILSPLNENNPIINIKSTVSKKTNFRVHCGDHRRFTALERLRVIGISAFSVKARYRHEFKKMCYTGVCFGHRMSVLFSLIFLA